MNLFDSSDMGAGYATSRPPVHARVVGQAYGELGRTEPFRRALDVGCGAGISTRALAGFAASRIGLEPARGMLRCASTVAPGAVFVTGTAEALPLRNRSVDLITAAGSLNYANLDLFFPEAARVLRPDGVLLVYDFSAGRSFPGDAGLDDWFAAFSERYPPPAHETRALSPQILAELDSGFRMRSRRQFVIALALAPDFYLDYILTETNVAAAARRGVPRAEIRSWCAETLAGVWKGREREVVFRGYYACMTPAG